MRRMKNIRVLVAVLFAVILTPNVRAQSKKLTPTEAIDHVGERATVCGSVVSTHFAARSKGQPTFLNLDRPYPSEVFTILIWGSDRPRFGAPESKYRDARICASGKITSYRGVAEIVASDPGQIEMQK